MLWKPKSIIVGISCIGIIFAACFSYGVIAKTEDNYWPADEWTTTTPEAQGMNSKLIDKMYDFIEEYRLNIQSVLILRNGYIVNEKYLFNSVPIEEQKFITSSTEQIRKNGTLHAIWSCTKSVISLLIDIAIEKGYISSVNETFFGVFPDKWKSGYGDEMKKNITIEHLLTMRSGLQWDEATDGFNNWWLANYTLDYVLKKPLVANPGTYFEYTSGGVHLLSAIIQNKTGIKTSEFAKQNLFTPIGIKDDNWEWDENDWEWGSGPLENITFGGWGIYMNPRAMGRIGLLCLNKGNWNGAQVVSENWINTATKNYVGTPEYGYLFWLKNEEYYYAAGWLGQRISVIPEYNIVMVLFSEEYEVDVGMDQMINDFIIKAVTSSSTPEISGYNLLFLLAFVSIVIIRITKNQKVKIKREA